MDLGLLNILGKPFFFSTWLSSLQLFIFSGLNFQQEVETVPPSCLCKYLFIGVCVWKYNECIEFYTWLLLFSLNVKSNIQPFNFLVIQSGLKKTERKSTDPVRRASMKELIIMWFCLFSGITCEIRDLSRLPMFVSLTGTVATVTMCHWWRFGLLLSFHCWMFFPFIFKLNLN